MTVAMIISVGTGEGVEHGIAVSIKTKRPDYIVFLVTSKSRQTIDKIKMQTDLIKKLDENSYEIKIIDDHESYDECYKISKDTIIELRRKFDEVIVDFTSGTKAMAAGLLVASLILGGRAEKLIDLCYIVGERDSNGRVISGTEKVFSALSFQGTAVMDLNLIFAKKMFNKYAFDEALAIVEDLKRRLGKKVPEEVDKFWRLLQGYSAWDKFDHNSALEHIRKLDNSLVEVDNNKRFLLELDCCSKNGDQSKKYQLLMVDLYSNALRRIEEGKYDDAVARLYRLIEMIAQYALDHMNINTSDIDPWILRSKGLDEPVISEYESLKELDRGKIRLPLYKSYELIMDLSKVIPGEQILKIGEKFFADKELRDLLEKRNSSILAHGLKTIDRAVAREFSKKVRDYLEMTVKDLNELIERSRFPKFDLTL